MLYLNKDLMKKQFGSYMTQFGMIMNIFKNMKYSDLNNVSEKEFGNDKVIYIFLYILFEYEKCSLDKKI